jgi:GDP-L-fucose synthase
MNLETQRIVVTGGAGFLGSHLVARLERMGCRGIVVPRTRACNLTERAHVRRLFSEARPDVVFHLAARVGGIAANQRNPGSYFHDNMAMGLNVLDEARLSGVRKVIIVGTICAYPKFAPVPFREEELWNGYPEETNAPYGVAKKALLVMAEAYKHQYGLNSVCLLPVNLYGPRDNFDLESSHVIPAMIRRFVDAKMADTPSVQLWGDGTPTREFLYVEDCAEALTLAALHRDDPLPINVGAGFEISIKDLATLISKLVGYTGAITWDLTRPNGQPRRMLDTSKAKLHFGFEARTSFEHGLTETIRWYKDHLANLNPPSLSHNNNDD